MSIVEFDLNHNFSLHLALFTNVKDVNAIAFKLKLQGIGGFCTYLNAPLILNPTQVVTAANFAVINKRYNHMMTNSLSTEVLHSLAVSRTASRSYHNFGLKFVKKNMLVALVKSKNREVNFSLLNICGKMLPLNKLKNVSNIPLIRQMYKSYADPEDLLDDILVKMICQCTA